MVKKGWEGIVLSLLMLLIAWALIGLLKLVLG
jgi:hypothetical protein